MAVLLVTKAGSGNRTVTGSGPGAISCGSTLRPDDLRHGDAHGHGGAGTAAKATLNGGIARMSAPKPAQLGRGTPAQRGLES